MNPENGGLSPVERQRQTAAEIARKKVLAVYSSTVRNLKNLPASSRERLIRNQQSQTYRSQQASTPPTEQRVQPDWMHAQQQQTQPDSYQQQSYQQYQQPQYQNQYQPQATQTETLKDTPINQAAVSEEWQKYHSAWQDYYKNYYSDYYAKAAQAYLATEKMKNERVATGETKRKRNIRHLIPIFIIAAIVLTGLFLQYNRLVFAPIMAYVSPDTGPVATSIEAIDSSINITVSPEPRLIIPKLNIDVPVAFGISTNEVDAAMNQGVAQFSIPGANALPGQIGNLVISGHSAGDIYSSNPYKFIFSGLERLEVGDLIYINYESIRYTYQMTSREVVEPTNVSALIYATDKPMLTLITCTPLGTSRYRLLISAEQISPAYNTENIAPPDQNITPSDSDNAMPANEPSFFENIWNGIFGS